MTQTLKLIPLHSTPTTHQTFSKLQNQISYTESPDAVSSDFVGTREAGVVDSNATIVSGNNVVLYLWYDNEFGYCCQVGRMVYKMAGVKYQYYPIEE